MYGVGGALKIEDEVLEGLDAAQKKLEAMASSADSIATKFGDMTQKMGDMLATLNNTSGLDASSITSSLKAMVDMMEALNKAQTQSSEDRTKTEIDLRNKEADAAKDAADAAGKANEEIDKISKKGNNKNTSGSWLDKQEEKVRGYLAELEKIKPKVAEAKAVLDGIRGQMQPISANIADLKSQLAVENSRAKKITLNASLKEEREALEPLVQSLREAKLAYQELFQQKTKLSAMASFTIDAIERKEAAELAEEKKKYYKEQNQLEADSAEKRKKLAHDVEQMWIKLLDAREKKEEKVTKAAEKQEEKMLKAAEKQAAAVEKANRALEKERIIYDETKARVTSGMKLASWMDEDSEVTVMRKVQAYEKLIAIMKRAQLNGGYVDDKAIAKAQTEIDRLNDKFGRLEGKMSRCAYLGNQMKMALQNAFSIYAIGNFVREMISVRGQFEMQQKTLGAIIGSEAKANEMFTQIQKMAVKSPFSVLDITKQTKQLAAYRIEADKLIDTTKMLGDISAGVGVDMNRLILAYGQVKSAEFLKGTELRQFSEAGVNMLGGLADRFSEIYKRTVSVGEVMGMVSKRMVKFQDVEAVLNNMTKAGATFYRMQEKQAETLAGQIVNLKDRYQIMVNEMGKASEGIIKSIVKVFTFFLSNWKVVAPILTSILVTLGYGGIAGMLIKVSKTIGNTRLQLNLLAKELRGLSFSQALVKGISGVFGTLGGVILGVSSALAMVVFNMNAFRREVRRIGKEGTKDVTDLVSKFRELTDVINDGTLSTKSRATALAELKDKYGQIIDIQDVELDNLTKINDQRADQIRLIKEQIQMETLAKARSAAVEALNKRYDKRLANTMEMLGASAFKGQFKAVSEEAADAYRSMVEMEILSGKLTDGVEANARFLSLLAEAYDVDLDLEGADKQLLYLDFNWQKVLSTAKDYLKVANSGNMWDTELNANAQSFADELIKIKQRIENFNNEVDKETGLTFAVKYKDNPAELKLMAEQYARQVISEWEGRVNEAMDSTDPDVRLTNTYVGLLLKRSESLWSEFKLDPVVKEVNQAMAKINEDYGDLIYKLGEAGSPLGPLLMNDSENALEFAKRLEEKVLPAIKKYKDSLSASNAGTIDQKQSISMWGNLDYEKVTGDQGQVLEATENLTNFEKAIIQLIKALANYTPSIKGPATNYKKEVAEFIREVRGAVKEFDTLNDEGDAMLKEKLENKAKKLKLNLPDLNPADIKAWIESLQSKIEHEDYLNLTIEVNKDETVENLEAIGRAVEDLWDKYDSAKKMGDLGISLTGYDATSVLKELKDKEAELREINTEDSIKRADDVKDRRLKIARQEQEEAAKIMYEAQKKSLNKVEQAYQDMYDNVGKIVTKSNAYGLTTAISQDQIDAAVNAQIKKSLKEVEQAQWDLYKSSEAYIMAFGDLEGVGLDVLGKLKEQLKEFSRSTNLLATDLKTINERIKKINDEESRLSTSGDGFLNVVKGAFEGMKKAKEIQDSLVSMRTDAATALNEQTAAQAEENAKIAEKINAIKDAEEATAREQIAYQNLISYAGDSDEEKAAINATYLSALADREAATARLNKVEGELADSTKKRTDADDKAEKSTKKLADTLEEYKNTVEASKKSVNQMKDNFDKLSAPITDAISLVQEFASALGLSFSDEANEAIEGFAQGFSLVSSALALVNTTLTATEVVLKAIDAEAVVTMATMAPLLAIAVALGAAFAIIKAADAAKKKAVENLKEQVDALSDAYDKLADKMDKLVDNRELFANYKKQLSNIEQQREKIMEAIAMEKSRGAKADDDSIKSLNDDLKSLDDKIAETQDNFKEMLGAPSEYQSTAKDWASSWLDAFKNAESGLTSLTESFDDFYNEIVVGQLFSTGEMAAYMNALKKAVDDAVADGYVDEAESERILAMRRELQDLNQELTQRAQELGVTYGSGSSSSNDNTLQKGIQGVTESTAQIIEGYLNSTRYYVADTNTHVKRIADILYSDGSVVSSPILNELRSHTALLGRLAGALTSNGNALNVEVRYK